MVINLAEALEAARLCERAYRESSFEAGDTQVLVDADGRRLVLAFRGTEPERLGDWATDAQVRKTSTLAGTAHRGFSDALASVWGDVHEVAREAMLDGLPIVLTGHSLGAALATLAAAMLHSCGIHHAALYAFGSPRVFSRESAAIFNARHQSRAFRIVNNNDVVCRVPPRCAGYRHVGTLVYIDHAGEVRAGMDANDWWFMFWDRVNGRLEDFMRIGLDGIKDHSMAAYIEPLRRATEA